MLAFLFSLLSLGREWEMGWGDITFVLRCVAYTTHNTNTYANKIQRVLSRRDTIKITTNYWRQNHKNQIAIIISIATQQVEWIIKLYHFNNIRMDLIRPSSFLFILIYFSGCVKFISVHKLYYKKIAYNFISDKNQFLFIFLLLWFG